MVNYTLGAHKDAYLRILNLDKILNSDKFKRLEDIDKFTGKFDNCEMLKSYLISLGCMDQKDVDCEISVMYRYNNGINKLPIVYRECTKYLDIDFLKHIIRSYSNDLEFLGKLAKFYDTKSSKYNKQDVNVNDIRYYIREIKSNHDPELNDLINNAIEDLFRKAVYSFNKKDNSYKFNYRGFRDLALFVYRYDKTKMLTLAKEKIEKNKKLFDEEQIESIDKRPFNYNIIIPGINDDEPYFAPNSEEEKMYNDYMDKLSNIDPEYFEELDEHHKK